jgi:hypothetical protein
MSRRKYCAYCVVERATDREHVFPFSWYPDNTPTTVQRLTVPSCRTCNERWKAVEESIGHDLIMVCDADHPDAVGVVDRIAKGWDGSRATTKEEAAHRERRAQRVLDSTRWAPPHAGTPQVPLKAPDGSAVMASPARVLDQAALASLCEKFMRGLFFSEKKGEELLRSIFVQAHLLPSPGMTTVPAAATPSPDLLSFIAVATKELPIKGSLGPGFRWSRGEGSKGHFWSFTLWGHMNIIATCEPRRIVLAR